jgi:hypothetical protein
MLAAFGEGQVLWSFLVFFFWVIWLYLLFVVLVDIFRSRDLSGVGKAVWVLFVVVLPYLGVFIYLLFRGGKMHEHAVAAAQDQDKEFRQYIRDSAGTGTAAELGRLADMRDQGIISNEEFERQKAKIVS